MIQEEGTTSPLIREKQKGGRLGGTTSAQLPEEEGGGGERRKKRKGPFSMNELDEKKRGEGLLFFPHSFGELCVRKKEEGEGTLISFVYRKKEEGTT